MGKRLIEPVDIDSEALGELTHVIPGPEPELKPYEKGEKARKIIPVSETRLDGNELEYVTNCVKTNWISSAGKYIGEFEEQFSECCGAKYGVACSSGTTALHLALATLGINAQDEVIIPTFTMIATANMVTSTGAKSVLVDSEMETWNIDVEKIEEKITEKTKALLPVHTYGHPVDMDKILAIADIYNLHVIEDAAEGHGAQYKGKKIGSIGDAACFSFYGNKIISTGEGGMVTTNSEDIAKIARNLRDHGFSQERHFWHRYQGFNYRMTNLQAAIGVAQTERLGEFVAIRRENAKLYNSLLDGVEGITTPPEKEWVKNVYWMYGILVEDEFGITRDELREKLGDLGVETRTFFIPMHLQPIYFGHYNERFPISEELCRKGMYLPSSSNLTKEEIEFVANSIKDISRKV